MWTAISVTVSNGSKQVTVNSGDSTSLIRDNSWLQIANQPIVEIQSVSGSTITLKDNWPFPTQTNQPAFSATTPVDLHIISDELKALYDNIVGSSTSMTSFMQALLSANSPDELAEFINAAKTTTQITGSNGIQVTGNWQSGYVLSIDDTIVKIGTGPTETLSNADLDVEYISKEEYEQLESAKTFDARFGRKYYEQYEVPYGKTRKTFDQMFTINRNSSKWCFGKDRKIVEVPPNQPAYEYDPATGEPKGILIEEQRTNLLQYSENFDNPYFNRWKSIIIPNSIVSPSGDVDGVKIIYGSGGQSAFEKQQPIEYDVPFTMSCYYKAGSTSVARLNNYFGPSSGASATTTFNLDTGTYTINTSSTNIVSDAGIVDVGNGWYRCWHTYVIPSSNPNITRHLPKYQFIGNSDDYIYVWGAQFEQGPFPTSYISTAAEFVSRASTATYIDSNGVLQTAAVNEPRENHVYVDGEWVSTGLLVEPSRTNLFNASTLSSMGSSTVPRLSGSGDLSPLTTTAPDGSTINAYTNTPNSTTPRIEVVDPSTLMSLNTPYTLTFYAKIAESQTTTLSLTILGYSVRVNIDTLTFSSESLSSNIELHDKSIVDFGNGWAKISIVFAILNDLNQGTFRIPNYHSSEGLWGAGDNIFLWGYQLEEGYYSTSYIPTSGSQVTRAADITTSTQKTRLADIVNSDLGEWFNPNEGTFVVELRIDRLPANNAGIILSGDSTGDTFGTNAFGVYLTINGQIGLQPRTFGENFIVTDLIPIVGENNKIAFSYISGKFAVALNGEVRTYSVGEGSAPTAPLRLIHGNNGKYLNTTASSLGYRPYAVSDAELQKLSSLG